MASDRATILAHLTARQFDVLVIGGGIVGAGIARDAAMRGLHVALVEQGDFASGTSSKTSKLIHGGLRYLEHGHLRLVMESLRERHYLRTIAPAYVHPLSILLPVYHGDTHAPWMIGLGLNVYDALALGRGIRRHRMLSVRRALALEPGLRVDGLRAAGVYSDCQMDDARVCLLNVLQAAGFGAVAANYVRVQALLKSDDGRVMGAAAEDVLSGRFLEIQARITVNATGPWGDQLRRLSDSRATPRLSPTKGIHLVVPRLSQEALFVQAHRDRRMFFVLPWGEYSIVGTTESGLEQPLDALRAEPDEVGYLLEETNRVLPGTHLGEDAVVATFAGARPLLEFEGASTRASREYRIEFDAHGVLHVLGGKFTTYRAMAQQAVDGIVQRLRVRAERCLTHDVTLMETVTPIVLEHWREVTRQVDPDLLARLLTRYGAGTFRILQLLLQQPALGRAVCPHHELIEAELLYACYYEQACTITDVLARRTRIAWSSCQGLDLLSRLVDLMHQQVGVPRPVLAQQVEAYHRFLADGLAFRQGSAPSAVAAASHDDDDS